MVPLFSPSLPWFRVSSDNCSANSVFWSIGTPANLTHVHVTICHPAGLLSAYSPTIQIMAALASGSSRLSKFSQRSEMMISYLQFSRSWHWNSKGGCSISSHCHPLLGTNMQKLQYTWALIERTMLESFCLLNQWTFRLWRLWVTNKFFIPARRKRGAFRDTSGRCRGWPRWPPAPHSSPGRWCLYRRWIDMLHSNHMQPLTRTIDHDSHGVIWMGCILTNIASVWWDYWKYVATNWFWTTYQLRYEWFMTWAINNHSFW